MLVSNAYSEMGTTTFPRSRFTGRVKNAAIVTLLSGGAAVVLAAKRRNGPVAEVLARIALLGATTLFALIGSRNWAAAHDEPAGRLRSHCL